MPVPGPGVTVGQGFSLCVMRVLPPLGLLSIFAGAFFLRRVNRVDILRWEFRFPLQFSLNRRVFPTLWSLVAFLATMANLLFGFLGILQSVMVLNLLKPTKKIDKNKCKQEVELTKILKNLERRVGK